MRRSLAALLLAATACSSSSTPQSHMTAVTQNLYLGGDILAVAAAGTPLEAAVATWQLWQMVQFTNFPARAKVIAAGIAAQNPDVIGLQEVSTWRTGPALVCASGGSQYINNPQASTVVYDFLASLRAELQALGLHYDVASSVKNADVEFCAVDPTHTAAPLDVRYTDFDVILVKSGTSVRNQASGNYQTLVGFPIAGTGVVVPVPRGWNTVEAQLNGTWYRIFETHLEVQELPTEWPIPPYIIQLGQAGELVVGQVNPRSATAPLPTVMLGDMNSEAQQPGGSSSRITYNFLTGQIPFPDYGYPPFAPLVGARSPLADHWNDVNPGQDGFSYGFSEDLLTGTISQRIDFVLTSRTGPAWMTTFGGTARTAGTPALHASDHLGVAAGIE